MDWHNRNMKILIGICIAVVLIVCYRIFDNIQTERARAERMSRVQAVAVVTAKPERRTITPLLEFSGSLDPEWQADVAAKVDGRVERVYVNEGDRVTKGRCWRNWNSAILMLPCVKHAVITWTRRLISARPSATLNVTVLYINRVRFPNRLPMITLLRVTTQLPSWMQPAAPCRLWNRSLKVL